MRRLLAIARRHPVLAPAFALALLATVFFTVRTTIFAIYWSDPAHRDQAVAGWMTPRYIAHSWQVPPALLHDAVGAAPPGRRPTLAAIAKARGQPLPQLIAQVEAAIAAHRAARE